MRVQHETCSTICGTPVQAILDQKKLTGLAGGVREGQNIAQNGPRFCALELFTQGSLKVVISVYPYL